eukprot:TCONS_00007279-protein
MTDEENRRSPAELNEPVVDGSSNSGSGSYEMQEPYMKPDYDLDHLINGGNTPNSTLGRTNPMIYEYEDSVYGGYNPRSEAGYPYDGRSHYDGKSQYGGTTIGRHSMYSPTVDGMTVDGMTVGTESVLGQPEHRFTVERKDVDSHMHRWYKKPSRTLSLLKFLLAVFVASVTLFCVVVSKLTVIGIAQGFVYHKPTDKALTDHFDTKHAFLCGKTTTNSTHYAVYENAEVCMREVVFVMLCIILMIPPAVTLIKLFVKTCRKITHPWPTKLAILWGAIGTLMESAGLSLFLVGLVMHVMDTDIVLILMNALFIIPVISQFTREINSLSDEDEMELSQRLYQKRRKIHIQNVILSSIAFIFQIIGIIGILYLLYDQRKDYKQMIIIPCAIILIGIGWSPEIRKLQIDHDLAYVWSDISEEALAEQKLPVAHRVRYFRSDSIADTTDTDSTVASTVSSYDKDKRRKSNISMLDKFQRRKSNIQDDARKVVVQTNTSRGKATLINCITKLIAIPIFMCIFTYVFQTADLTHVHHGFFYLTSDTTLFVMFVLHLLTSIFGYHLSWMSCSINLQRLCFAIPLTLATPVCIILVLTGRCGYVGLSECSAHLYSERGLIVALASIALWLGQFFATTYYAWKSQDFVMAEEATLFWVPTWDGSFLEQNMLLNRKNEATNEYFVNYKSLVKKSHVYICTTMYHEADYEMEQFLFSIADIDRARKSEGRMFECHIWFDDGVRDTTLKTFALQLISLLPRTIQVELASAKKLQTPYGMELRWTLPGGLPFHLHLKDTFKVRNKKRWSQVMYMSYILDFRERENQDYSYILTTDADVQFHPEDVSALMDFMSRDPSVGAVCGRTKPKGTGPIAWYQMFDYAIDSWLLKVAEHVMGSVLCSPGCFSIYRCRAIEDVLPEYASSVGSAIEFLRKDMGEDRWLCTLMMERGWRLDYCASATVTTYCPEEFNEFFKQRKRWGPSRMANQALLIQRQKEIRMSNDDVNIVFIVYQVIMLVSIIIGPGTAILIVSSGLHAAFPSTITLIESFCINVAIVVYFVWVCLYKKQEKQLRVAQFLTFVYAMLMNVTIVGFMVTIADDLYKQRLEGDSYYIQNVTDIYPLPADYDISKIPSDNIVTINSLNYTVINTFQLQFTPPTLFLFFLAGMFLTTALLHGSECLQLVHGLWYLLCLPSSYIFLMIFSIANISDRSWGTREERPQLHKPVVEDISIPKILWMKLRQVCFCCFKEETDKLLNMKREMEENVNKEEREKQKRLEETNQKAWWLAHKNQPTIEQKRFIQFNESDEELSDEEPMIFKEGFSDGETEESDNDKDVDSIGFGKNAEDEKENSTKSVWAKARNVIGRYTSQRRKDFEWNMLEEANQYDFEQAYTSGYDQYGNYTGGYQQYLSNDDDECFCTVLIEDWLYGTYSVYISLFKDAGYDDTTFLMGMKEPDLIEIGIENRGHRKKILSEIHRLPPEDMDQNVPEDVYQWLVLLGLGQYWMKFQENSYDEPNFLADLKLMDKPMLSKTFGINKPGHLKKLVKAIKKLKYPTSAQRKIRDAKRALDKVQTYNLAEDNINEHIFWEQLRKVCLHNEEDAFSQSDELKSKLMELRNSVLVVFAVFNVLWLVVMMGILNQGEKLKLYNSNFLSVTFLVIYVLMFVIQFYTLVIHRISTWMHFVSRTPFKPGASKTAAWDFNDDELKEEPAHEELEEHGEVLAWNLRRRSMRRTKVAKQ